MDTNKDQYMIQKIIDHTLALQKTVSLPSGFHMAHLIFLIICLITPRNLLDQLKIDGYQEEVSIAYRAKKALLLIMVALLQHFIKYQYTRWFFYIRLWLVSREPCNTRAKERYTTFGFTNWRTQNMPSNMAYPCWTNWWWCNSPIAITNGTCASPNIPKVSPLCGIPIWQADTSLVLLNRNKKGQHLL